MFVIRRKDTANYLQNSGEFAAASKDVKIWENVNHAYNARYRLATRERAGLQEFVVEECEDLSELRRWLSEGVNEAGEACAYPNDKHGEHDHSACLDAADKPRFFGLTDAELKGIAEDPDPSKNVQFRDLAGRMSAAVRHKPSAISEILARGFSVNEFQAAALRLGTEIILDKVDRNQGKQDARAFIEERSKIHRAKQAAIEAIERIDTDRTIGRAPIVDVDLYCESLEITAQRMAVSASEFGMFSKSVFSALIVAGREKEALILGAMARFVADYREITD